MNPRLSQPSPRPRPNPATLGQLPALPPAPLTPKLFGRQHDLTLAIQALARQRVVALTGAAGSGKSALATALADHLTLPLVWIEMAPGLSDNAAALIWQLARPLARIAPQAWRALHQIEQAGWHYPALVRLQLVLDAYAQHAPETLIGIDRIDRCTDPALESLVIGLADYVARTYQTRLQLIVTGRTLPYELLRYATPPLAGLRAEAVYEWAQSRGLAVSEDAAAQLVTLTGGLPLALEAALHILREDPDRTAATLLQQPAIRQIARYLLSGASRSEQQAAATLAAEAESEIPIPTLLAASIDGLAQRHLVDLSAQTVTLHPLLRALLRAQPG